MPMQQNRASSNSSQVSQLIDYNYTELVISLSLYTYARSYRTGQQAEGGVVPQTDMWAIHIHKHTSYTDPQYIISYTYIHIHPCIYTHDAWCMMHDAWIMHHACHTVQYFSNKYELIVIPILWPMQNWASSNSSEVSPMIDIQNWSSVFLYIPTPIHTGGGIRRRVGYFLGGTTGKHACLPSHTIVFFGQPVSFNHCMSYIHVRVCAAAQGEHQPTSGESTIVTELGLVFTLHLHKCTQEWAAGAWRPHTSGRHISVGDACMHTIWYSVQRITVICNPCVLCSNPGRENIRQRWVKRLKTLSLSSLHTTTYRTGQQTEEGVVPQADNM